MFSRVTLLGLPALLLANVVSAQDMTNSQLTSEVRALKTQYSQLGSKSREVEAEIVSLRGQVSQISGNVTKALEAVNENGSQMRMLKVQVDELNATISEELRKQQQILDAISEQDASGGYIPRLSAAMSSQSFRRDLDTAVHQAIRREGSFEVTNMTGSYQWIQVNRVDYGVNAGETLRLTVPVGTVTTRLPGKEKENWTITAPSYRQGINIVVEPPVPAIVAGRPIYVTPPGYVNPPIYNPVPVNPIPVAYR